MQFHRFEIGSFNFDSCNHLHHFGHNSRFAIGWFLLHFQAEHFRFRLFQVFFQRYFYGGNFIIHRNNVFSWFCIQKPWDRSRDKLNISILAFPSSSQLCNHTTIVPVISTAKPARCNRETLLKSLIACPKVSIYFSSWVSCHCRICHLKHIV